MATKTMPKKARINPDSDEEAEGISYEKGLEFEREFAKFMKQDLLWSKVRVGAHMAGSDNAKGANIDIVGERLDAIGITNNKRFKIWMYSSITLIILAAIWHFKHIGEGGVWFMVMGLLSSLVAIAFLLISDRYHSQNSWVECKNLKGKTNINQITKMVREINDYKKSKDKRYRFTHYYFASANGYVENALKMAMDNNITCFMKDGKKFVEVKYWS